MTNPDHSTSSKDMIGRRRWLYGGGAAVVASTCGAMLAQRCWHHLENERNAEVFKGAAPTGELWQKWQSRGWAREARHYFSLGRNLQCHLCPNECLFEPGDRSHCRNKVHKDGKLYTLAYGNPCALHIDPIEKKPLFHFLPGIKALSLAASGCNFRCLNCQNWEISQITPEESKDVSREALRLVPNSVPLGSADVARLSVFPEDAVRLAQAMHCNAIAYTYSEPISYFEYMFDCAQLAQKHGLRNLWITNGYIKREPLLELAKYIDAANVNLKCFDEQVHRRLNQGSVAPVLETLRTLQERHVWFEVTHLVIPTYTDNMDVIRRMCHWLVQYLGPEQPLHLSRFSPKYRLNHLPATPLSILQRAREVARAEGLKHVYIGNASEIEDSEDTHCAGCGKLLIVRHVYDTKLVGLNRGACSGCGKQLAGVFS